MFSGSILFAQPEQRIVLQTRRGRDLKNAIDIAPEPRHFEVHRRLKGKHPRWAERIKPTGGYNCLGLLWASRRTCLFDDLENQIAMVFEDDGYRVLDSSREEVVRGDLVAYWTQTADRRIFLHAGLVVEVQRATPGLAITNPLVLSKFDSTSGEFIHSYRDVEFPFEYSIEFWTDRPGEAT